MENREPLPPPPRRPAPGLWTWLGLGGIKGSMAFLFLGLGLVFTWLFVFQADLWGCLHGAAPSRSVPGTVVAVERSGWHEGARRRGVGRTIRAIRVRFPTGSGDAPPTSPPTVEHEIVSYSEELELEVGDEVRVEVPEGRPDRAVVQGARRAPIPPFVLGIFVLPVIGLGLLASALRTGGRRLDLIREGVVARARLLSRTPTGMKVNGRPWERCELEVERPGGAGYRVTLGTHRSDLLAAADGALVLAPARGEGPPELLEDLGVAPRADGSIGPVAAGLARLTGMTAAGMGLAWLATLVRLVQLAL